MKIGKPVFKGWLTFSGRRNRLSYFLVWLAQFAMIFVPLILLVLASDHYEIPDYVESFFLPIWLFAIFLSCWIVMAQRFRDFGESGWCALPVMIVGVVAGVSEGGFWAIVQSIMILAILLIPGTKGENKYGPDPLQSQPPSDALK